MKTILTLLFLVGQLSLTYAQNWVLDFDSFLTPSPPFGKQII